MTVREFEVFALAAAIAAMWSQVRSWLAWPLGLLVVRRRVDSYSSGPILGYLHSVAKWSPPNGGHYSSDRPFVRPLGRAYRVWYEALKEGRQTFWLNWRPVWYSPHEIGPPGQPRETTIGMFWYLRWSLDWERLLEKSAAWEDVVHQDSTDATRNRFCVVHHGKAFITASDNPGVPTSPTNTTGNIANPAHGQRLLHWQVADLVCRTPLPLESLSLRSNVAAAADRVRQWIQSKEWCEERGIPWRLGLSLGGPPGTGKTSFARALAVEHNLPIHVFDLAGLDNFGFRCAWNQMLGDAPCMALIEDIDAIFEGRKTAESVLKQGIPLTFDALLNGISGVQAADGVLLVVTSNHPETLDEALLRPGRLDVHVVFKGLDRSGRLKMATRILRDEAAAIAAADDPALTLDDGGAEVSPAVFQERLCCKALADRFEGA